MEREVAPLTDQERVEEPPLAIENRLAVKDEMTGSEGGGPSPPHPDTARSASKQASGANRRRHLEGFTLVSSVMRRASVL
jgi:hypothetical protein